MRLSGIATHDNDEIRVLDSVHEFVIAPRPNVGARLATVGPCQTLAWLSNASMPALRTTLYVTKAVSLVVADAARNPVRQPPVDGHTIIVLGDEILVAVVLHQARNAIEAQHPRTLASN